jgi:hypothetical protein
MNVNRYLAALLSATILAACTAGDGPLDPHSGATNDFPHQMALGPHDGDNPPIPLPPIQDPRVTLTTDRQSYAPGEAVQLTLRNGPEESEMGEALGVNLCNSHLERRYDDGSWVRYPQQSGAICEDILQVLWPGQSVSEAILLPSDMAPGEYRFGAHSEGMDTGHSGLHASNGFQVGS